MASVLRNTHWSYTALRAEHGEEGALALLWRMPGKGQYDDFTSTDALGPRDAPPRDIEMHPDPSGVAWVMPWETWSMDGVWDPYPTFPDGVWFKTRAPLADSKRNWW